MTAPHTVTGLLMLAIAAGAAAQEPRRDPAALMAAQREAMASLAFMDGVWRGPFEMKLTRVGDSEWPGAGAVPLR